MPIDVNDTLPITTPNGKNGFYQAIAQAIGIGSDNKPLQASDIKNKVIAEVQIYYDTLNEDEKESFINDIKLILKKTGFQNIYLEKLKETSPISNSTYIALYQDLIRTDRVSTEEEVLEAFLTQRAMNINIMFVDKDNNIIHQHFFGKEKAERQNVFLDYDSKEKLHHLFIKQPQPNNTEKEIRTEIFGIIANNKKTTLKDLSYISDIIPGMIPEKSSDEIALGEPFVSKARAEYLLAILPDSFDKDKTQELYTKLITLKNENSEQNFSKELLAGTIKSYKPTIEPIPDWLAKLKDHAETFHNDTLKKEQLLLNDAILTTLSRKILLDNENEIHSDIVEFLNRLLDGDTGRKKLFTDFNAIKALISEEFIKKYSVDPEVLKQFIQEKTPFILNIIDQKEVQYLYNQIRTTARPAPEVFTLNKNALEKIIASKHPAISISQEKAKKLMKAIKEMAKSEIKAMPVIPATDPVTYCDPTTVWKSEFEKQLNALNIPVATLIKDFEGHLKRFYMDNLLMTKDEFAIITNEEKFAFRNNILFSEENLPKLLANLTIREIAQLNACCNHVSIDKETIISILSQALGVNTAFLPESSLTVIHIENIKTACNNITALNDNKHINVMEEDDRAIAAFFEAMPRKYLEKIIAIKSAELCITHLRNDASTLETNICFFDEHGEIIEEEPKETFDKKGFCKYVLWKFNQAQQPILRRNLGIIKAAAKNALILKERKNLNQNDDVSLFLRGLLTNKPDYSEAPEAWKALYNATTQEEIYQSLKTIKLITEPNRETQKLVNEIFKRRQVFALYDSIYNAALAKVFKQVYPDIKLDNKQIDLINQFLNADDQKAALDFLNRNELADKAQLSAFFATLGFTEKQQNLLSPYIKDASDEIAYHHWSFLRLKDQKVLAQRIQDDRSRVKEQLKEALASDEENRRRRHEQHEIDESTNTSYTKPDYNAIPNEIRDARIAIEEFEGTNFILNKAITMERVWELLLSKAPAPNGKTYDVEAISNECLLLQQRKGTVDELNDYMQKTYNVAEIPPFMTKNDFDIIQNGHRLETSLIAGNFRGYIENIKNELNANLSKNKRASWYFFGKNTKEKTNFEEALESTQKLYGKKKISDIKNHPYTQELDKLRTATIIGGGKKSFAFAKQQEKYVKECQQHFDYLVQMMDEEEALIEKLETEKKICLSESYKTLIDSSKKNREAFADLCSDIEQRKKKQKEYRGTNDEYYEAYSYWSNQLKDINFNIQRTLKDSERDAPLVLERHYQKEELITLTKSDWNKKDKKEYLTLSGSVASSSSVSSSEGSADMSSSLFVMEGAMSMSTAPVVVKSEPNKHYLTDIKDDEIRVEIRRIESPAILASDESASTDIDDAPPTASPPPIVSAIICTRERENNGKCTIKGEWIGELDHNNDEHKKALAEKIFKAVTDMLIKGYLDVKHEMPNAKDPIRITARDKLAAEYLMATCSFYQAIFPELNKAFEFREGAKPDRTPEMNINSQRMPIQDKVFFPKNDSMKEFLALLEYASSGTNPKNMPFSASHSLLIKHSINDCRNALNRANSMKVAGKESKPAKLHFLGESEKKALDRVRDIRTENLYTTRGMTRH